MKIYKYKDLFVKYRKRKNFATLMFLSMVGLVFFGCSTEPDRLVPNSQQIIVQEKKVIVSCKIPKIECDFTGTNFEPTKKLIECIKKQKEAIRICNDTKIEDMPAGDMYGD